MEDKVVIVTGAGSGLGRELAKAFCAVNAKVIGLGRSSATLQETSEMIEGENFDFYVANIGDEEQVENAISTIIGKYGRVDILFNNAAVYPKVNFLTETASEFTSAMATNVLGIAFLCKQVLPHMIENKYGRIINLGSWADQNPIADSAVYSASKGALHALTKGIAKDVVSAEVDLEIHEWIPGHLNTQMSEYTGMDPAVAAQWATHIVSRSFPNHESKIFVGNKVWVAQKSLKQKIKKKLLFWK